MDDWQDALKIALTAAIVTVVINLAVSAAVLLERNSRNLNDIAASDLSAGQLKQFSKYDGRPISGAEVAVFITKHSGVRDVGVVVYNGVSTKMYIRGIEINGKQAVFDDSLAVESAGKLSSDAQPDAYVKPSDLYIGKLFRNQADVIVGVRFEKQ